MHPHVSGARLGEASHIDFRRLCSVVATMEHGVWLNLGSAVVLPEVLLKAVSVVRNFGHSLDGLVTVNIDKQAQYRSKVNVLDRPASEGLELIGHHEIAAAVVARGRGPPLDGAWLSSRHGHGSRVRNCGLRIADCGLILGILPAIRNPPSAIGDAYVRSS